MDHSKPRPGLPGSTPAAVPTSGKSNVYQTTSPAHFTEPGYGRDSQQQQQQNGDGTDFDNNLAQGSLTSSLQATQYRKSQERAINMIVKKLPYQLASSVSSLMNMTLSASETAQRNYEITHHELIDLRNELNRKNLELEIAQKTVGIYRSKLKGINESMDTLKDDLDIKQKHALRSQKYLSRLSSTNKMLIGSLNALDVVPPSPETRSAEKKNRPIMLRPMSYGDGPVGDTGGVTMLPQIMDASSKPSSPHAAPVNVMQKEANSNLANEKLRASLLRVAREHYLSQKLAEGLERKVDQQRHTLREAETKARQLQNELNELKSVHSEESTGPSKSSSEMVTQRVESAVKVRSYGKIDDRFKSCIKREALKPEAALMTVRRIMEFMSHAPLALTLSQVAPFLASKEANRIFDTEIICLYIKQQSSMRVDVDLRVPLNARPIDAHRYSVRTEKPEELTITPRARGEGRCLVHECFLTGHPARSNNLHRVGSCDPDIDACAGVVATRIMSVPLRHIEDSSCLGVVHFINKAEAFSEADELMAIIFADCAAAMLSQAMALDRTKRCMNAYRRVLESAVLPYSVIPDPNMVAADKALGPAEVLLMLEDVTRGTLKCRRSRAFLVHAAFAPEGDEASVRGQLLMLDHNTKGKAARTEIVSVSDTLGIAGYVATSREVYLVADSSKNERLNPQIDLEVLGEPVLSLPVIDHDGSVLAVIQLTPGPHSPKMVTPMVRTQNPEDQLLFSQAAQWLAYQLCAPLVHIYSQLRAGGKPSAPDIYPLVFAERRVAERSTGAGVAMAKVSRKVRGPSSGGHSSKHEAAAVAAATEATMAASAQEVEELRAQLEAAMQASSFAAAEAKAAATEQQAKMGEAHAHAASLENDVSLLKTQIASLQAKVADAERLAQAAVDSAVDAAADGSAAASDGAASPALLAEHADRIASLEADLAAAHAAVAQAEKKRALAAEAAEADKRAALAAKSLDTEKTNAALIAATERCTVLQAQAESLTLANHTSAAQLAGTERQVASLHAEVEAAQVSLEQKESVIAILQTQLVKMAEDSISGLDLSALRESLAASVAKVARPSTGTGAAVSPLAVPPATSGGQGAGLSQTPKPLARAPSGSRPPTSHAAAEGGPAIEGGLIVCEYPWTELVDDEGTTYYFNSETQESSWDPPGPALQGDSLSLAASDNVIRHGDWIEMYTEEGSVYYQNEINGETTWELPPDAEQ